MVEVSGSDEVVPGPEDMASERLEARLVRCDADIRRSAAQLDRAEAAHGCATGGRDEDVDVLKPIGEGHGSVTEEHDHVAEPRKAKAENREGAAHRRERIADEREAEADERDRIADEREAQADERERVADHREAAAGNRERVADYREAAAGKREDAQSEAQEHNRVARSAVDEREVRLRERELVWSQREAASDQRERTADEHELAEEMRRSAENFRPATPQEESMAGLINKGAILRAVAGDLAERLAEEADDFAAYLENAATRGYEERRLAFAKTEHEIARIGRQNAAKWRDPERHQFVKYPRESSAPGSAPEIPSFGDRADNPD
ncbi:MAG: hypothetical protein ACRDZ8_11980 [Acidimicrobiales bacterium]